MTSSSAATSRKKAIKRLLKGKDTNLKSNYCTTKQSIKMSMFPSSISSFHKEEQNFLTSTLISCIGNWKEKIFCSVLYRQDPRYPGNGAGDKQTIRNATQRGGGTHMLCWFSTTKRNFPSATKISQKQPLKSSTFQPRLLRCREPVKFLILCTTWKKTMERSEKPVSCPFYTSSPIP